MTATDYHTAGEPFRIVTGGVPPIPGRTILEKRRWAQEHLERVRKLLVYEPRGHADMYGCFVTEPEDQGADLGVLFFHNAGYSTACGHGTIALATAAVETGMVPSIEPETRLTLDVPPDACRWRSRLPAGERPGPRSGTSRPGSRQRASRPQAWSRTSRTAEPSTDPWMRALWVLRSSLRTCPLSSSWGAMSSASSKPRGSSSIPEASDIRDIYGVIFWQDEGEDDGRIVQRNVTVFADGEVDRSPCGSGTSARLALLGTDRTLLHRSVIGTEFEARIIEHVNFAGRPAVVTEIAGSAHRTGSHEFVLEPDDPLGEGFCWTANGVRGA